MPHIPSLVLQRISVLVHMCQCALDFGAETDLVVHNTHTGGSCSFLWMVRAPPPLALTQIAQGYSQVAAAAVLEQSACPSYPLPTADENDPQPACRSSLCVGNFLVSFWIIWTHSKNPVCFEVLSWSFSFLHKMNKFWIPFHLHTNMWSGEEFLTQSTLRK